MEHGRCIVGQCRAVCLEAADDSEVSEDVRLWHQPGGAYTKTIC